MKEPTAIENSTMAAPPRVKYGMLLVRVGSNHVVKCADNVRREFRVRDAARHPNANRVVVCLTCNRQYASKEELLADSDHPDYAVMAQNSSTHVWGYWSEDAADGKNAERVDRKAKDKDGATVAAVDYGKIIGLMAESE